MSSRSLFGTPAALRMSRRHSPNIKHWRSTLQTQHIPIINHKKTTNSTPVHPSKPSMLRPLRPLPILSLSFGFFVAATITTSSRPSSRAITMATTSASKDWPVKKYTPRHTSWPYNPSDFTRQDEKPDPSFYSMPRFVTHIDDAAIATLREYYDSILPRKGRILDFCSSWVSHYPAGVAEAAAKGEVQVVGMGMNQAELNANPVLNGGKVLADLNADPDIKTALAKAGVLPTSSSSDDSKFGAFHQRRLNRLPHPPRRSPQVPPLRH